jgi:hypothetical protein
LRRSPPGRANSRSLTDPLKRLTERAHRPASPGTRRLARHPIEPLCLPRGVCSADPTGWSARSTGPKNLPPCLTSAACSTGPRTDLLTQPMTVPLSRSEDRPARPIVVSPPIAIRESPACATWPDCPVDPGINWLCPAAPPALRTHRNRSVARRFRLSKSPPTQQRSPRVFAYRTVTFCGG